MAIKLNFHQKIILSPQFLCRIESFKKDSLEKQKGYAVVLFLCFTPILIALFTFLFIGTTQIELRSELNQVCRSEILKVEEHEQIDIRALMALNLVIDVIKTVEIIAFVASLFTGPLALIFEEIMAVAENIEKAIPIVQKGLLLDLQFGSIWRLYNVQSKMREILKQTETRARDLLIIDRKWIWGRVPRPLSVEAENPKARLTKYKLKENFEHVQNLYLIWNYRVQVAKTLSPFTHWDQYFHGYCAATLRKDSPWPPTLYADKFLSNFL